MTRKTLSLKQRTIQQAVHAIGIGVHSGEKVGMSLRPAPENTGIVFVRSDLDFQEVRAYAENVSDTTLSTSISQNGVQVATVEHLMSALWGIGIDNLYIELTGEEVPIMDGSAAPFVDLINSVGIIEQHASRHFLMIKRELKVKQGDAEAILRPFKGFKATYTFAADHPVYNRYPKLASIDFSSVSYVDEVSQARSFGLESELCQAQAINKCLGSSLDNAVGIGNDEIMNEDGLRCHDEFVKHKLLDVMGDLYLLGKPILGEFVGFKSGHALNNKLARALLRVEEAWELVTFDLSKGAPRIEPMIQPGCRSIS
jgi:UDP-3-O-[3-hydroxymyristoyl] N-acetylglucosamine deacetylase